MFNIHSSTDRLILLKADFEKLMQDPLSISLAEKTCSDAWHLSDWVFSEQKEKDKELTKEKFRINLYLECPEMRILHDLANTFKHKELTNPKAKIKEAKIHGGAFSSGFSKAFDVSRLEVHYNDDSQIDVDDLVKLSIEYWERKLNVLKYSECTISKRSN
jgi:hypothetical protein